MRVVATHLINGTAELVFDDSNLIVSQFDWTGRYQLRRDLYRWTWAQVRWERVTRAARVTNPEVWGDRLLAIRIGEGTRTPVVVGRSGETTPLAVPDPRAIWRNVVVSPDGRWMAGARHVDGQWDVVAWPVGRVDSVVWVTDDQAVEGEVAWGTDGALLCVSDITRLPQIYEWDRSRRTMKQLTSVVNGARAPQRSSDGVLYSVTIDEEGHRLESVAPGAIGRPIALNANTTPMQPAPDVEVPSRLRVVECGTARPVASISGRTIQRVVERVQNPIDGRCVIRPRRDNWIV